MPLDVKRQASFATINVMMDGVNSTRRSPEAWQELETLRQRRAMEGKGAIKRSLLGVKCPAKSLHDVCPALAEGAAAPNTDPSVIRIDETEPRVRIFDHVPLSSLADASIPRAVNLE